MSKWKMYDLEGCLFLAVIFVVGLIAIVLGGCQNLVGPEVGEVSHCQRTTAETFEFNVPGDDNSYVMEVATCAYRIEPKTAPLATDKAFMVTQAEQLEAVRRLHAN